MNGNRPSRTESPHRRPARARRGAALVFVLGILTLVALVGTLLLARTHNEARRLRVDIASVQGDALVDSVVQAIKETLRADIWGPALAPPAFLLQRPLTNDLPSDSSANPLGLLENNEPYDAPGPADRWLASTTPYMHPNPVATGNPANVNETQVLAWHWVSCLGSDIALPSTAPSDLNPFMWPGDSRGLKPGLIRYDENSLRDVPILQTPPPSLSAYRLIPGSTTNYTINQARADWQSAPTQTALGNAMATAGVSGITPRFPYFDTNADGILDLYDADGDGIPDSPLSLVIPAGATASGAPRELYAAVRIVDHASMLNVNVASSLRLPGGAASDLMFDETLPGLQRRGQRVTELLLDDFVHADDRFNSTKDCVNYRSGPDPVAFDADIVRTKLVGQNKGSSATPYALYGLDDEASLRHRGMLVPYSLRLDAAAPPADLRTIDRSLRGTLLFSRETDVDGSYNGTEARWSRFNADFTSADYEGYDNGLIRGWRSLLTEDEPFAIRRRLMTTVGHDVVMPPDITSGTGLVDQRLLQLWSLGMDWPTLIDDGSALVSDPNRPTSSLTDRFLVPTAQMPPEWARPQRIDLNMRSPSDPAAAKLAFLRYSAAAMYLALEGQSNYQGIDLSSPINGPANREYLAWQFALNLVDFRDDNNTPSMVEWPAGSGRYLFGVEKQPFFTEAIGHVIAGLNPSVGPAPFANPANPADADRWFFAVELFVPPYWNLPSANLYLRTPDVGPTLYPLSSFRQIATDQPPGLDGGPNGSYIVLCSKTNHAPASITSSPQFQLFYRNNSFLNVNNPQGTSIELVYSPTGSAADPQTHVIDVIGPDLSTGSAVGQWAKRSDQANQPYAGGSQHTQSLRRSTKGWRFTIARQAYSESGPARIAVPGRPPFQQTLGLQNGLLSAPPSLGSARLDVLLPEAPWPGRVRYDASSGATSAPPDGFDATTPYNCFDSVGELSRMFTIGAVRYIGGIDPTVPWRSSPTVTDLPATAALEWITRSTSNVTDLPAPTQGRLAAGRVNFKDEGAANTVARRLCSYFTTQSPLFDGVDNDSDGKTDLVGGDATEAWKTTFRQAGRININTAPVSVLRSVPFMSLLPSSPEYQELDASYSGNPFADFNDAANDRRFWDMATALVATREGRDVPLRLWNPAAIPPIMQNVAIATPPTSGKTFESLADLADLTSVTSAAGGYPELFRIDRFTSDPTNAQVRRLQNHKYLAADPTLGGPDVFSPDFRFRRLSSSNNDGIIDFAPVPLPAGAPVEDNAGIRGRDVFLARWANLTTTRSDVFTAYIAIVDADGRYVRRASVTLDRSDCFREWPRFPLGRKVLPRVLLWSQGSYGDDTK